MSRSSHTCKRSHRSGSRSGLATLIKEVNAAFCKSMTAVYAFIAFYMTRIRWGLKVNGPFSGEATLPFSFLLTFSIGVNSERKEFAPPGANSFL